MGTLHRSNNTMDTSRNYPIAPTIFQQQPMKPASASFSLPAVPARVHVDDLATELLWKQLRQAILEDEAKDALIDQVGKTISSSSIPRSFAPSTLEAALFQQRAASKTYRDHANDDAADYEDTHVVKGGVTTPFPMKLHEMLKATQEQGMEDIVSWQPHGRCFVVHKPKEFTELLPRFFKLSKYPSFQRQLNLYGFQRLTGGKDRGAYYHEFFLRDREFLGYSIQRMKVKGTGVRSRSRPDQEPNLWSMPWVQSASSSPSAAPIVTSSNRNDNVLDAFEKTFHFLNPFEDSSETSSQAWDLQKVDRLLEEEANDFFDGFEFQIAESSNLEDDNIFGDILEQMMC